MDYRRKYLKYKTKYLKLTGGVLESEDSGAGPAHDTAPTYIPGTKTPRMLENLAVPKIIEETNGNNSKKENKRRRGGVQTPRKRR